jgi:DNA-binding NarL/FixJ family response regulator
MPITAIFADDYETSRRAILRALEASPDIEVLGEAKTYAETIGLIEMAKPQAVVMDLHMPTPPNFQLTTLKVALAAAGSRLIAISVWRDAEAEDLAKAFGAHAFLDKASLAEELVPTIKRLVGR